ncbi:transcriptional regulator [Nitrobacteraceae bacterium AZCC 2161]
MPTQRLSMRRIREVLRLRQQGLTERVIARMLGVSIRSDNRSKGLGRERRILPGIG